MTRTILSLIVSMVLISSCGQKSETGSQLGQTNFIVEGSAEAMPYFDKGLLLLHSFEYEDAAEEFKKARELDPNFAMAYWGEAMTYNHTLWSEQEIGKAKDVLNLLGADEQERSSRTDAEIEKSFISAVGILFESDDDKLVRDQNYMKYMRKMYEKYPEHHDVAAFYSLSLLGSVPDGRDVRVYEQAAEIAKVILEENPEHPGALHYLIHSYDDPQHAELAINAADKYSKVAPDAAHALHMPTHIYLALGMWDKVISSNIDSWEASKKRKARKELDNNALGYHSYSWLHYGMLQNGRFQEADSMLSVMIIYTESLPSKRARSYLVRMKGAFLVETNEWDHKHSEIEVEVNDLSLLTRSANSFINGMTEYSKENESALDLIIESMSTDISTEAGKILVDGITVCSISDNESQPASQLSVDQSRIMELELRGLHSLMINDTTAAFDWLTQATALESSISYSFGPPDVIKPSHELYGELLLTMENYDAAAQMFTEALSRAPGRSASEKGKEFAADKFRNVASN